VPERVPTRITADSRYILYVNGWEAFRGPIRSQPRRLHYDMLDLAPHLKAGENVLAAYVKYYGSVKSYWMPAAPNMTLGKTGVLVFEADLGAGGWLVSDDSWRAPRASFSKRYRGPMAVLAENLIRDNDSKYGRSFARVAAGIEVLRTPYRAPKADVPRARAICERFLGSLHRECLDHILILGEGHPQRTIRKYASYFNHARPHQGIEQRIPCPPESLLHSSKIVSLPILGGLHHDYHRQAA
jgi:hypothetical protein